MKKKFLAATALTALAPLALLCACNKLPALTLSSNWLNDTTTRTVPEQFLEELEYDVTFEKSALAQKSGFSFDYSEGVYRTRFAEKYNENGTRTYLYSTSLSIKVQYSFNSEKSEEYLDTVQTSVEFLDVANGLQPVKSERRIRYTAPHVLPEAKLKSVTDGFQQYNQLIEISYGDNQATLKTTRYKISDDKTYTDEAEGEPTEKVISLKGDGSFFDNEQLIVVLRGAELSASTAFRTIDATSLSMEKLKVSSGPKSTDFAAKFTMNGNEIEKTISAREVSLKYNKQNSGGAQNFVFASKVVADNNTYRNVLLQYEVPVVYSHGILTYNLKSALFSA